eukprot:5425572-Heterocapsa_arctica.AAC.1
MGFDPFCRACKKQGLAFGWQQLRVYHKDEDDDLRGLTPNLHAVSNDAPDPNGRAGLEGAQALP